MQSCTSCRTNKLDFRGGIPLYAHILDSGLQPCASLPLASQVADRFLGGMLTARTTPCMVDEDNLCLAKSREYCLEGFSLLQEFQSPECTDEESKAVFIQVSFREQWLEPGESQGS